MRVEVTLLALSGSDQAPAPRKLFVDLNTYDLTRLVFPRRRNHAVSGYEDAATIDIEKDAYVGGPVDHADNRNDLGHATR